MTIHDIKAMIQTLAEAFPDVTIEVSSRNYACPSINVYQIKTYAQGTELMRQLGCGNRTKTVYAEDDNGRCVLQAHNEGVDVAAYVNELPPTCRIETVVERVLATSVVQTGEYIEIPRRKVICTEVK